MKLFDYLDDYNKQGIYPFHMPGHKRQGNFINRYDYTEVEGLDNLYHSEGILKEMTDRIKNMYGASESFLLVNGSTTGILTALTSGVNKGEQVLVARNCHKSVYNAIELWDIKPTYIMPNFKMGIPLDINPKRVQQEFSKNPNIKAMILTSPTYEGVVSNIKAIAEICHSHNALLIVDEAHGSHLKFSSYFPKSAVELGADIVVHSTHKTLTSLTGTGLLHICSDRVNVEKVKKRWQTFQTSSPNYLMMASVDECFSMLSESGKTLFKEYESRLEDFLEKSKSLNHLKIFRGEDAFDFDKSKIVIMTGFANITGVQLQNILRNNYKIELEMASQDYALAMTSIMDSDIGFSRLLNALIEIDSGLLRDNKNVFQSLVLPKYSISAYDAESLQGENVSLNEAVGRVSREYIYAYPPGIPLIVPGEIFTKELVENIKASNNNKVNLISESNKLPYMVQCTIDTMNKMG
jgi:arginine/lysine/ornithine decarboxylase